ncbi:hypothetical protein [Sinosporangium siamense]|uniref:Uncharacterized protein n=1 Tax=Sinosporangium siamense TaxID=1367973 RepID=A0A919VGQ9_9ACTN|nr:hypothetical protein [Sinosporangium siamense]GII97354.1 hypothetical protein Ssi02_75850 [Sinosporangium siamense]
MCCGAGRRAEAHHRHPLVPLRLLNRPTVKWSSLIGLITFGMCITLAGVAVTALLPRRTPKIQESAL